MEDDELRFQLDLAKAQLRYSSLNEAEGVFLQISFPLFVSLGLVYVSFGLATQNNSYIVLGSICIFILIPIMSLFKLYFKSEKVKKNINDAIEREFKTLYDKYLPNDPKDKAKA